MSDPSDVVGVSSRLPPMTEAGVDTPGLSEGPRSTYRSLAGLTLVELLIAIAVVTLVVMIAYPSYVGIVVKARETAALAHMSDWPKAQLLYHLDNGHFATSLTQLYDAGYLVPVDSGRIGYTFKITQLTAAAPRGRMMAAFATAPEETWWGRITLVRPAWADGKDKDKEDKGRKGKKDKGKDKKEDDVKDGKSSEEESSAAGEIGWEGYADPTDERPRHFYTDHTNEVRFAKGRRATRNDPKVHKKDKNKAKGTKKGVI